ncbi:MAG TPA: DUF1573 domain-containing protein [Bacteroidales bacterium]|nr:DUF1573 domain-containing protein [Bacteroidales bacterium]HPL04324.1 DUF1573 domain-containing protein [Bacteroidales bacterium]
MKTKLLLFALILCSSFVFGQNKDFESPAKTSKQSIILFKSLVYDFGKIKHESEAKAVFVFKKVSKKPVKITNVKTSCGCAAADWSREEITNKKKQKISIVYDSRIIGKFTKYAYVYVEGQDEPIQLQIKGEVLPSDTQEQAIGNKTNVSKKENKIKSMNQKKNKINNN